MLGTVKLTVGVEIRGKIYDLVLAVSYWVRSNRYPISGIRGTNIPDQLAHYPAAVALFVQLAGAFIPQSIRSGKDREQRPRQNGKYE
jgi:hypothetical protein